MKLLTTLTLLGALTAAPAIAAQDASADAATQTRIARVEHGLLDPVVVAGQPWPTATLADRMRQLHVPGLSVTVIDGGRIAWTRSYGLADAQTGRPLTTETALQTGSLSKPVAAVLAMRLREAGRLDLDADVAGVLPLKSDHPITTRALLSHTAGLPGGGFTGYDAQGPLPTPSQILRGESPAQNPPVSVTGSPVYRYSSLGYVALQQVLAPSGADDFATLAQRLVLRPLAMTRSFFAAAPVGGQAAAVAHGHDLAGTPLPGGFRRHPELAAAGLWSTSEDMARLLIAVDRASRGESPGFLRAESARALLTPVGEGYGLGFELDGSGLAETVGHSGSNVGYKALMLIHPRTGQGAVVLTNGDGGWPLIEALVRAIAAEYRWPDRQPIERAVAAPSLAWYDRYVGRYSVSGLILEISRDGDKLMLAGPPLGDRPVQLLPSGEHRFFIREKDAQLKLDPSDEGPVRTLTFIDGRPRPGRRVEGAAAGTP